MFAPCPAKKKKEKHQKWRHRSTYTHPGWTENTGKPLDSCGGSSSNP